MVPLRFDVFRFCRCLRYAGGVMILVVLAIEGFLYQTVCSTYIRLLLKGSSGVKLIALFVLLTYTAVCTLLTWSYFVAVFSDPGTVPQGWHPFNSPQEEEVARDNAIKSLASQNAGQRRINFCRKCQAWKPPRSHHCSVLGTCVLKLDHFCLWVVNSVGLLNYKAFLLFIGYSALACIETGVVLLPIAIRAITKGEDSTSATLVFISTTFSLGFAIALLAFVGMHWDMVARNYTSIESIDFAYAASWPHDRGTRRNFAEVFGRRYALWPLPLLAAEDREWLLAEALEAPSQPLVYALDRGADRPPHAPKGSGPALV
eukprot:jgi/Ulvmu1/1756/UM117_0033.1